MSYPEGAFTDFVFGKGWVSRRGIERFEMGVIAADLRTASAEGASHGDDMNSNGLFDTPLAERERKPMGREVSEALESYLNSSVCLTLFAKLLLYRALGEVPKIRVDARGRVSLHRPSGDVEHFNRDGGI